MPVPAPLSKYKEVLSAKKDPNLTELISSKISSHFKNNNLVKPAPYKVVSSSAKKFPA